MMINGSTAPEGIVPKGILLALLCPIPAYAQAVENPFQFDPVEHYASRVLGWVLIIGIGLVLYCLVSVLRGRGLTALTKALLVVTIVMVPLFSISSGMLLVFERAKRVEFCGSCHRVMKPYVDDMKNPTSEGMAAIHYKDQYIESNQCYECHTSYGLFGTLEAKMAGTIDTYRYYSRTYKLPIKMRHPYPNGDCLKCHAQSAKWLSQEAHTAAGVKESLFSGQISCMDCHGAEHPAHPIASSK